MIQMASDTSAENMDADRQAILEWLGSAELNKLVQLYIDGIFPGAITHLLRQGLLDKDRLSDGKYVIHELLNHWDLIETHPIAVKIEDEFVQSARDVLAADRPIVTIVPLAAAVEQRVNTFYRTILAMTAPLTEAEITEIIRANSIFSKLGWLLSITSGYEIDDQLKKRLLQLTEFRNQTVHFKAVPGAGIDDFESGSYNLIESEIDGLDMNDLCSLPDQLNKELTEIEEAVRDDHWPEYKEVKQKIQPWMDQLRPFIGSLKP
jgi:hypothetical protein